MAVSQPRPNSLFALADDWAYGHAGAYGCGWVKTPAFDRVAREGVFFKQAYTPTAKCAPSGASTSKRAYSKKVNGLLRSSLRKLDAVKAACPAGGMLHTYVYGI